ncbi:MAG: hypothetical protein EAZ97_15730 [Bacteroidetes bacterium]|nr:MAG: hypothetical protein EAZ97_15730 [Bacteroidota bacterium]
MGLVKNMKKNSYRLMFLKRIFSFLLFFIIPGFADVLIMDILNIKRSPIRIDFWLHLEIVFTIVCILHTILFFVESFIFLETKKPNNLIIAKSFLVFFSVLFILTALSTYPYKTLLNIVSLLISVYFFDMVNK